MSQANQDSSAGRRVNPQRLTTDACRADDPDLMAQAIAAASEPNSRVSVDEITQRGLRRAAMRRSAKVLTYLLDYGADVSQIGGSIAIAEDPDSGIPGASREILELLIAHGWDINAHGSKGDRWPLLWYVLDDEGMVRWCLDHGARVDLQHEPVPNDQGVSNWAERLPLILEVAAKQATLATFKVLRERGAPLGRYTLHEAAQRLSLDFVRYLVGEVGIDVNADGRKPGSMCMTPLSCVAYTSGRHGGKERDCKDLVWFLLDRGGDPDLGAEPYWPSAMEIAEKYHNEGFLEAVKEWRARRGSGRS